MPLTIVEIIKQAEQGLSSPFLCRGDDGELYFVKGRASGRASLWAEWLGGHLGRAFGLPIPSFCIAEVPAPLIRESSPELRPLGSGPAFASRNAEGCQWLELAAAPRVGPALQRDILVFDWWLQNGDRTRGNPNLLWHAGKGDLVVIDHNQAFDTRFSAADFWAHHLFAAQRDAVFADLAEQAAYAERLNTALSVWDEACDNVPPEWHWENDEQDLPATFDPVAARALVALFNPRFLENGMSLFACRYAVVQFLPYAETGEFANVGVVLLCPDTGYFGFRLQNARRTKRITGFFERLDRSVYARALDLFQQELVRVKTHFDTESTRANGDAARQLFTALTHPREAIVRFAPTRAIMTAAPEKELEALFGRYVEHDFATPEHREEVLEKRIGQLLRGLPLAKPFQAHTVGNDETRARFPFVLMENDRPIKAIKPLFLAQDEPHKIFEHADFWLPKMRRLRARGLLPEATLISTEAPPEDDGKRFKAFEEVRNELGGMNLLTVAATNEAEIQRFALAS